MTPLLTADLLGHRFSGDWLFRKVSFDLNPGDRLVITGRNGSGKSTLLKCLVGLMTPREGKVTTSGKVGYSALDLAVYPQLTAHEHLELFNQLNDSQADTEDLLTQVGLVNTGDKPAGNFSTGMRGRLKIALALASNPNILVLDEPTAAIDTEGRNFLDQLVNNFPGAVILATNDLDERRWATHELTLV